MSTDADWIHGKITDEAVAVLRSRLGRREPMSPESEPYTRTQIMRYLAAFGDDNPLFWDADYAAGTRWGGIIAPPRLLVEGRSDTPRSVARPLDKDQITFMGEDVLEGVFAMISGERTVFERPVRLGDRLRAQAGPHAVVERPSRVAGRSLELVNKIVYLNQRDETVATVFNSVIRMERGAARDGRKYLDIPEARYTAEEMDALDRQYELEREQRRGDRPRYWEDTQVGEALITLAKGPLTVSDVAAFFLGKGSVLYTNRVKRAQLKANPAVRLVNPNTNIEDNWLAAHWDQYFAEQSGLARPYDEGPMRFDYMAHLVTDWMGDDAALRELSVSLRRPNLMGDLSWCTGKVADKRVEAGRPLVDLDLWVTNQRGERTTQGSAIVELPTRG